MIDKTQDPAAWDLGWIIRSLEIIARPSEENESGIGRMVALKNFIDNLKGKERVARPSPASPAPQGADTPEDCPWRIIDWAKDGSQILVLPVGCDDGEKAAWFNLAPGADTREAGG